MIAKPIKKKKTNLKKKAQDLANRYARLRDCPDGYGYCISCGERRDFEQMDGGHFIPTTSSACRFDETNIHAQCTKCNRFLHGNQAKYLVGLERKLGRPEVDRLLALEGQTKKWTDPELEEIIGYYQAKIQTLTA